MSPERIVLGIAAFLAIITLVKLMQRRQEDLVKLLRVYVDGQLEWSRKKARAALMARRAARDKEPDQEGLNQITEMIHAEAQEEQTAA